MFKKLLAGKRGELEYRLMRYYYNDDMETNRKAAFMFAQYADILRDISHDNIIITQNDDIRLTPDQIDNITSTLGGLFLEYIMKVQGKDITDCLRDLFKEFNGEDNEDEK